MRILLPLLAAVLLLGACGTPDGDGNAAAASGAADGNSSGAAGGIAQTENDLRIDVDRGNGTPPESWTLVCAGVAEGTHPEAQAACDHLAGTTAPFAPLPDDVMCTEQYGGPQTAHITGRWRAEAVDLQLSRVDGCRIAQWDALGPLLPTT
ncbi:MAG TPA: SSI family serine proteinase inhibitor [Blastococcus sp.]|nr:SSI family serine proteinase inhibitor [Blastococcus sp.]